MKNKTLFIRNTNETGRDRRIIILNKQNNIEKNVNCLDISGRLRETKVKKMERE